ncbi:hypothetical protein AVEN_64714-1 [Araneus ventricosus]|uniref:Histone-lysine N-methyltransferase SETMAR n=1 Tax=Araneus ventricosus TaxID=182803 RepID=A0A4Y2SPY7_ARAVE|nr:hypothetical protein AVEN_126672-1 [Araneus ventricosus]GBN89423.1 hypothetical protein AVEN_137290-1 [Araneus ventricosus]GBN89500.1 hypothetical protein AVEN_64714-1 [Araneus ventricosus]
MRTQLLQRFGGSWEVCVHPAYSPDLTPSDYLLFQHLKRFLAKQHFPSDDDVQTDGCNGLVPLRSPAADLFDTGVQNLVSRYDMYFNFCGSYVESDYHLFQHLKRFLAKQYFPSDDDDRLASLRSLAEDLLDTGVQKFVSRYDTCFNSCGSYVDKWLKECCIRFNKLFQVIMFYVSLHPP